MYLLAYGIMLENPFVHSLDVSNVVAGIRNVFKNVNRLALCTHYA